jgi:hypothetical protein
MQIFRSLAASKELEKKFRKDQPRVGRTVSVQRVIVSLLALSDHEVQE